MNTLLTQQTRDIIAEQIIFATEQIIDALENGDAIKTARDLRDAIIAGWKAALEKTNCPAEIIKMLALK